ncbi:hypothetical protein KAR91_76735 [Candidatus Pacearchaeota archaeon]|nr:hypothetical protein [Candidatus Pacearchaeota archaeon]
MSTLNNPGPHDCLKKVHPDEPIFVLCARDPLAPRCVRKWAYDALQRNDGTKIDKINEALKTADEMEEWQKNR